MPRWVLVREIRVGTSGWSYDDWVGPFYPKSLSREGRLDFYAERFPIVEVNYTHYQMPVREHIAGLARRMDEADLEAVFKAPRSITHEAMPEQEMDAAGQQVTSFYQALDPMAEAGRLDGLLFQFSHWAGPDIVVAGIRLALEQGPPAPVFVEVRAAAFNEDRHHARLRDLVEPEGALVATDGPAATIMRAPPNEQAYYRFHGRNWDTWFEEHSGDDHGSPRYDHLYDDEEIHELAERVDETEADRVRVFFNNHPGGQAARNGMELMDVLDIDPPKERVTLDDFE